MAKPKKAKTKKPALTIGKKTIPANIYKVTLVTFTVNHAAQHSNFFCADKY